MAAESDPRAAAVQRIKGRREFYQHLATYLVVNVFLVVIWAMTGREGGFWPAWVILGWGIGVVAHAWKVFAGDRPISEEDIQREMQRKPRSGT